MGAGTTGDLYVTGSLEVDKEAFFDGRVEINNSIDMNSGTLNVIGGSIKGYTAGYGSDYFFTIFPYNPEDTRSYVKIGNAQSNLDKFVPSGNDLFICGSLEVDADAFFENNVYVAGSLEAGEGYILGDLNVVGDVNKAGGSFVIDHPLDPASKVLRHSFVESPDRKNVYDGVVYLDENGEAVIELPNYFEALNTDFRYQLTTIGGYAPVYIAEEISNNKFRIAGGKPGMKLCWMVTGTRCDVYALDRPIIVEEEKAVKGTYLYPGGFNKKHALRQGVLK